MKLTEELKKKINKYFNHISPEELYEKYKNSNSWEMVDGGICMTLITPDGRVLYNCEMKD